MHNPAHYVIFVGREDACGEGCPRITTENNMGVSPKVVYRAPHQASRSRFSLATDSKSSSIVGYVCSPDPSSVDELQSCTAYGAYHNISTEEAPGIIKRTIICNSASVVSWRTCGKRRACSTTSHGGKFRYPHENSIRQQSHSPP